MPIQPPNTFTDYSAYYGGEHREAPQYFPPIDGRIRFANRSNQSQDASQYYRIASSYANMSNGQWVYNEANGSIPWQSSPIESLEGAEKYLFYGTLKAGHRNNDFIIKESARRLCRAKAHDLSLIELFNGVPAAVLNPGAFITGEIWELLEPNISLVAQLEEGYVKQRCIVETEYGIEEVSIFVVENVPQNFKILPYMEWTRSIENDSFNGGLSGL